jgi:zinc/manganese transport system substrate-binding protein
MWFGMIAALILAIVGSRVCFAADKINVVATTSIIGDWVRIVGDDHIQLTTLAGPDNDPHDYEPIPADSIAISQARIIFENGLGLEQWLDKLYSSAQSTARRVVVTDGVTIRHIPTSESQSTNGQSDDRDPHAWQDVSDAVIMVGNIRKALADADPPHAAEYNSRAAAYISQLKQLDTWVQTQINSIPPARRKLTTSHDAFGYFGQRYGMDISRSALESVTTEAADPSARQLADVIDQVRASGVPVIFLENIQNPKLINQIAADANVKVGPPLYSDALGASGSAGDTYIKMIRYNVTTLVNALK